MMIVHALDPVDEFLVENRLVEGMIARLQGGRRVCATRLAAACSASAMIRFL